MPKFSSVFSNDGKGAGGESAERRSGMSAEEIANRLYPKPTELWRKDEQSADDVKAESTATSTAIAAAPAEEPGAIEANGDGRSSSTIAVPTGDGQVTTYAAPISESYTAPVVPPSAPASAGQPVDGPVEKVVSVISRNSVFDGNYSTDGDVRVEGEVRGDITCKGHVLICDGASVSAKITATSVAVAGRLSGEVTCSERFEAQPTARITSQISTPRLVIQDGAILDGEIRMGAPE